MPLQRSFWHKLAYDIFTTAFQWDQDALAQGVLQGHRRARLLQTCEQALPQTDLHEHRNSSPDAVWNIINTAVVEAAQACYKQKNKHATDPANTKDANEKMVVARATLAHLPRKRRFSAICQTSVSIDFLSALLQQWRGLAQYWKAGNHLDHLAKPDRQKKTANNWKVSTVPGSAETLLTCGKLRVVFQARILVQKSAWTTNLLQRDRPLPIGLPTWPFPAKKATACRTDV